MKNKPALHKNGAKQKDTRSLLLAFLTGILLLIIGVGAWLVAFFFPAEGPFFSIGVLLLGVTAAYVAVSFSQPLLCQAGWKATWPMQFFCYAVVVGVLLKRGQSGLQGGFFFAWWGLFFVLLLLWFVRLRANNKRL